MFFSFKLKRKYIIIFTILLTLLMGIAYLRLPNNIAVTANTRKLPIYCVKTDKKQVAISFDAAWGKVKLRQFIFEPYF